MIIYNASTLGSCIRAQVAARLGKSPTPFPASTLELFRRGHELEGVVLDRMAGNGWVWEKPEPKPCRLRRASDTWDETCGQVEVLMPVTRHVYVGAHLDAVGVIPHKVPRTVVEVKSCGGAQFEKVVEKGWDVGGIFEKYKWQTSVQTHASGCCVIVAVVNRDDDEQVAYLHKPEGWYSRLEVKQRVLEVEYWVNRGELPPCDKNDYPCPFFYLHDESALPVGRDEANWEVERWAMEYKQAKLMADEGDRLAQEARRKLKEVCGTRAKLSSDRVSVTWYKQKNPPRLDKEKVEGLGLKVEDITSQSESERVRVEVKDV